MISIRSGNCATNQVDSIDGQRHRSKPFLQIFQTNQGRGCERDTISLQVFYTVLQLFISFPLHNSLLYSVNMISKKTMHQIICFNIAFKKLGKKPRCPSPSSLRILFNISINKTQSKCAKKKWTNRKRLYTFFIELLCECVFKK